MNQPVSDQRDRDRALDTALSCIVQAPAGSGKTELLSQRFLALLARAERPEAILAITFTRKAASEMRLRILNALDAAQQDAPEEPHKLKTWQLAREALAADQRHGWHILQSPMRLKVLTIDSLNAALARQMPILSGMGVMPGPEENSQPFYLEAARRTLAALEDADWQDDLSLLMLHLGNNTRRIQELLVDMLARRDQWLRHLVAGQSSINRRGLEQALQNMIEDHLQQSVDHLPAGFTDTLAGLALFASRQIEPGKNPAIESWQSMEETLLTSRVEHLLPWQGLSMLLLTQDGRPRARIDKSIGFPGPSSTKDKELKALWGDYKQRLQDGIDELKTLPAAVEWLARTRCLPAPVYADDQWQLLDALTRILLMSAAQLRLVFSEQGKVDFSEVAQAALQALGDDDEPTDLAMILDYRLQHILVDEFQDTSNGQFTLLQRLTRGWQADDGRTLFLVGDPMQSIYRFREAEVGLYLQARREGIGGIQLTPLTLDVNFRSEQGIVDWVNQHLASAFADSEDKGSGAVCYSRSTPFHPPGDGDAVTLHARLGNDPQAEALAVCQLIDTELKATDNNIAILVRSRSQLTRIISTLKTAGLAFQAVDLDLLREQPAIVDLHSLMLAMLNPSDRLHWLAVLRAPWCGLTLPDLLTIAETPASQVWQNCLNPDCIEQLSADGQQRLANLVARLGPLLEQRGRLALQPWLARAWHRLGGNSLYADRNSQEALQRYWLLLAQHQQAGYLKDTRLFEEALEKLFAAPDRLADGRLQIMTIHKSKGLEFDTVILPGMGKTARGDSKSLLQWLERPNQNGGMDLLLSPIKASSDADDDPISNSLKTINQDKARHELTRLLYVALTRAKRKLHLFAHATLSSKGQISVPENTLLGILWHSLEERFQSLEADEATHENPEQPVIIQPLQRLPKDWQPATPQALAISEQQIEDNSMLLSHPEFDWASDTARFIGTVTHAWLEQLTLQKNPPDTDGLPALAPAIALQLTSEGVQPEELDHAVDRVLQALQYTLQDATGQWLLQSHPEARSEYALTYYEHGQFRKAIIDRTFIDDEGVRWIIDYKTGSHAGGDSEAFLASELERYRPQLEKYAYLLSRKDQRPIRLGLYFPLMQAWRHWDYQPAEALA